MRRRCRGWTGSRAGKLQCATAQVPLDYTHPNGRTIQLALVRRPATDPAHRIGTLFAQPGGPGSSGVDVVIGAAGSIFTADVRARFDIVGVDQRGVARSAPIRCFSSNAEASQFFGALPPFPVGREEEASFISAQKRLGRICARSNIDIMRHMSSANVARDYDLLRRAVGDPKITFYGQSYGTFIGEVYANLFPGKVRALALDSVIDPVAWATGRGDDGRTVPLWIRLHSDRSGEVALHQFLTLCKQAGDHCAFSSGSPRAKLDALLARLRHADPSGAPTYASLISTIYSDLYFPASWPSLATTLQSLYDQTAAPAAASAAATRAKAAQPDANYDNYLDAASAVMCVDTDDPRNPHSWHRATAQAAKKAPHFAAINAWYSVQCATWPARDKDRYTGPFTTHTASPALVIGNLYDPVTSYRAAQRVTRQLRGAGLLTYTGWGHTTFRGSSACINDHLARYLLEQRLPPAGATCVPEQEPFA